MLFGYLIFVFFNTFACYLAGFVSFCGDCFKTLAFLLSEKVHLLGHLKCMVTYFF